MSTRRSHDVARTELPRSSELATVPEPERTRTEGRDGSGRFTSGNPWAPGAKWRSLIAEGLGRHLTGGAGKIGKRAYRLYRAFLADMPCDSATVRSLLAERARAQALADFYAELGLRTGPHKPEGLAHLAESRLWGQRSERLAVTALDVSTRLARVAREKPIDAHAAAVEAFGGDQ